MEYSKLYNVLSGLHEFDFKLYDNFKKYDNVLSSLIDNIDEIKQKINLIPNDCSSLYEIETLEGNNITIEPGHEYKWTLSSNSTISISGCVNGKAGQCRIEIENPSNYSLTPDDNVIIKNAIESSAINYYTCRFSGLSARLYLFDVDEL